LPKTLKKDEPETGKFIAEDVKSATMACVFHPFLRHST
jgi:hypothetical protein